MSSMLRSVLTAFENADAPCTLNQLARELDIAPGMLDGMIDYWVRKGKLRPVHTATACNACGSKTHCPFIMQMPPTYELVTPDSPPAVEAPVCTSCT